jgi:hypothetical protein
MTVPDVQAVKSFKTIKEKDYLRAQVSTEHMTVQAVRYVPISSNLLDHAQQ